ncbi:MAG: gamma carbonic anhydrase family protein [Puniceicoccaceae bacterium]
MNVDFLEKRFNSFLNQSPTVPSSAYVAGSAELIGAVHLGEWASVWPKCVLRADIEAISIGEGTNIQDGTIIHLADDYGVEIGSYTTVGHGAMLHACRIGNECLIGMRAIILDGAEIGDQCIVGAGSLVTKGTVVEPGSLVLGSPAKVVRVLSKTERSDLRKWADKYIRVSRAHKARQGSKR